MWEEICGWVGNWSGFLSAIENQAVLHYLNDWLVNAEIPISDLTLQLVWVPDQTYHELPEAGSVWTGVDVFYGTGNGLFGQFGENDRVLIGMEFGF